MKLISAFQLNTNWVWRRVVAHKLPRSPFSMHFLSFSLFLMKNCKDASVFSLLEASTFIYFLSFEKFRWWVSFLFFQCEAPTTFFSWWISMEFWHFVGVKVWWWQLFLLFHFYGVSTFYRHKSPKFTPFFFPTFVEFLCSISVKVQQALTLCRHKGSKEVCFFSFFTCETPTF